MKVPIKAPACNRTGRPAFEEEDGCYKDIYGDLAPGELPELHLLRHTLAHAGYKITKTEVMNTHPVVCVHVGRTTAPRMEDKKLMLQHFRKLLRYAGFPVQPGEVSVSQRANRILLAFQWSGSPLDYGAGLRQAEADAAEFVEIPP